MGEQIKRWTAREHEVLRHVDDTPFMFNIVILVIIPSQIIRIPPDELSDVTTSMDALAVVLSLDTARPVQNCEGWHE